MENYAPSPSRLRPGLRYHRATSAGGGKVRGGLTSDTYLCEGLLSTHPGNRAQFAFLSEADGQTWPAQLTNCFVSRCYATFFM